jgi:uncharacterized protein GlcG (DUF336 family)
MNDDQWPGSRVISAQKANTANAFSLDGFALSTANLWAATQPGGSLFGLQFSNPVDPAVAYGDNAGGRDRGDDTTAAPAYGTENDPLVGKFVGGVNVFGGGLGLFNASILGAIGVSGDTSCADHVIAWRTRDTLALDNVPAGVAPGPPATGTDNIIFDIQDNSVIQKNKGKGKGTLRTQSNLLQTISASGFGHPECGFGETDIAENLPNAHPIGD